MKEGKWIRWLGAFASLVVMAIPIFESDFRESFIGSEPNATFVLLYLGLMLLPAFDAMFLSAFARFWWTFSLGLWLFFLSVLFCIDKEASPVALLLVLATITLCVTPFLNMACRPKRLGVNENALPADSENKQ